MYCVILENTHTPTTWKVTENSGEEGVSKAKSYKGKYEAKVKFPEGWGSQNRKPPQQRWGRYGYFLGTTHQSNILWLITVENPLSVHCHKQTTLL